MNDPPFPIRPIKNDAEHDQVTAIIDEILARRGPAIFDEDDPEALYLDQLSDISCTYENRDDPRDDEDDVPFEELVKRAIGEVPEDKPELSA